jgi:SAM-dependent methyltransferase
VNAHPYKQYWADLAENYRAADPAGLAPILHPGAPLWFNRLVDELQFRAIRRALALAELPPYSRILDVGCGTGRWLRRYQEFGLTATGVDAAWPMLQLARQNGTAAPLAMGEACELPFADEVFDCVSDITVVQHIPMPLQPTALGEMVRVLKPGGCLILVELIRGQGAHIFPLTSRAWIRHVTSRGAKLIGWFGQEYLMLDRFFVRAAQRVARPNGNRKSDHSLRAPQPVDKKLFVRRAYWGLRFVTASLSAWVDPVIERILPADLATHGVFIFRK